MVRDALSTLDTIAVLVSTLTCFLNGECFVKSQRQPYAPRDSSVYMRTMAASLAQRVHARSAKRVRPLAVPLRV